MNPANAEDEPVAAAAIDVAIGTKRGREHGGEPALELVEREFQCAEQMGRGEILPRGFVHLETTDDDPMLVRSSAITSVQHSGKDSMTWVTLLGQRISVRGSYEATIAKLFSPELADHLA